MARLKRAGDAGSPEIVAVRSLGRCPDRAVDDDVETGFDLRVPRERRGDTGVRSIGEPKRRHLTAVADRADRLDDGGPGAIAGRRLGGDRGRQRQDDEPSGESCATEEEQASRADAPASTGPGRHGDDDEYRTRHREDHDEWPDNRCPEGGDHRSHGQPTAHHHGVTVTRSLSLSKAAAPITFRSRNASIVANGCSSRAAMIFWAVTGPTPGRASSSDAVA